MSDHENPRLSGLGEANVEILEPVYDDLVDEVRAAARLRRAASVSAPVPLDA